MKEMILTKLDKEVVGKIIEDWFSFWNDDDLVSYVNLYSQDAMVFSNCAKLIIPDSNGIIQGKNILFKYWTIVKEKLPHFKFVLNSFTIYEDSIIFRYGLLSKRDTEIYARMYLNSDHKISKLEVAYFDSDFEDCDV